MKLYSYLQHVFQVLQCSEEASVGTGEVMEPGTMLSPAFSQTGKFAT